MRNKTCLGDLHLGLKQYAKYVSCSNTQTIFQNHDNKTAFSFFFIRYHTHLAKKQTKQKKQNKKKKNRLDNVSS